VRTRPAYASLEVRRPGQAHRLQQRATPRAGGKAQGVAHVVDEARADLLRAGLPLLEEEASRACVFVTPRSE